METPDGEDGELSPGVGQQALLLLLARLATLTIVLGTNMLLVRVVSREDYGSLAQVLIAVGLANTVFLLGFPSAVGYFLPQALVAGEPSRFVSTFYAAVTTLSVLGGVLLVVGLPLLTRYFSNPRLGELWPVLLLLPWATVLVNSLQNVMVVLRKTKVLLGYQVLQGVAGFGAVGAVVMFGLSFQDYLLLYLMVQCLSALVVYPLVNRLVPFAMRGVSWALAKEITKFSIPLGIATAVGTITTLLAQLIVGSMAGTSAVAVYAVAGRELPLTVIAGSISAVVLPRTVTLLGARNRSAAISLWRESAAFSYVFMAFFASALIVFAPEVVEILYSEAYLDGVGVFRVYALALLLRFAYFGLILNSLGRSRLILLSAIISLVVNVVLGILFFGWIGLEGPAWATVVAILVGHVVQVLFTARLLGSSARSLVPWGSLGWVTAVNIVMSGGMLMLKFYSPLSVWLNSPLWAVVGGGAWGVLYFAVLFRFTRRRWAGMNQRW